MLMKARLRFLALMLGAFMVLMLLSNQVMLVSMAEEAEETAISYQDVTTSMGLGKLTVSGEIKRYSYPICIDSSTGEISTSYDDGYMYKIIVPSSNVYELSINYNGSSAGATVSGAVLYPYTNEAGEEFLSSVPFELGSDNKIANITISEQAYLILYDCEWSDADIVLSDVANIATLKDKAIAVTKTGNIEGVISEKSYIYSSERKQNSRGFLLKATLAPGQGYSLDAPSDYRSDIQFIVFNEEALGVDAINFSDWAGSTPVFNDTTKTATYYIWVSFYDPNIDYDKVPIVVSNIVFVSDMPATAISVDGKATAVKSGTQDVNTLSVYEENDEQYYRIETLKGSVYSIELPANSAYTIRYEYTGETVSGEPTIESSLYVYNDKNLWMRNLFISNTTAENYVGQWAETRIVNSESTAKKYYLVPYGVFTEGQMMVSVEPVPQVNVSYRTHIQSYGWEADAKDISKWKSNGTMSGTSGKAKRLEGINIVVDSAVDGKNVNLGIQYTTHCQSYGWLPWSSNGEMNGTEGEAKRLEAIMIKLTDMDEECYDVYYRVHAQSYGWLGWAKNGEPAGTAGYGKRLEGIQIVVVPKGGTFDNNKDGIKSARTEAFVAKEGKSPIVNYPHTSNTNPEVPGDNDINVSYRTHVQKYGWQGWKYNGQMSGTSGESKRLEGIEINLTNMPSYIDGDIVYTTHVQKYGWQGKLDDQSTWKKNGEMSGTSGEAKRLEAICINLTGGMAENYDIYYRVHAQSYGWLGWASNGAPAGTAGYGKRLEGIQIVLVPKGETGPAKNYEGITSARTEGYISK